MLYFDTHAHYDWKEFDKHSRNNSLYLKYIVNKIAEIKEMTEEDVIRITTKNAYKVYAI